MTERDTSETNEAERRASLLGTVINGRYRVVGFVGSGGMGSVYRVEHVALQKPFALKLLNVELAREPGMVRRFEREALAAASIRSEYVVSVVDCDSIDPQSPYFVMELLEGISLRQLLARERVLASERAVDFAIDTCLGLAAVHAAGFVHRDVKPDNLFVIRTGEGRELAKLLDFGVAKLLDKQSTRPGALLGTLSYMAPEQVRGTGDVGPAADVFSLGVTLYECLAGQSPFRADALEQVLYRIMNGAPDPLEQTAPHVASELGAAVERALARQPTERFASALDFAEALRPFASRPRGMTSIPVARENDPTAAGATYATTVIQTTADAPPVSSVLRRASDSSGSRPSRRWALPSILVVIAALVLGATVRLRAPGVSSPEVPGPSDAHTASPTLRPDGHGSAEASRPANSGPSAGPPAPMTTATTPPSARRGATRPRASVSARSTTSRAPRVEESAPPSPSSASDDLRALIRDRQ